jgi:hypothetical protein
MNTQKKSLIANKFEKVGEWDMQAKYHPCDEFESNYNTHPSVYVWVVESKLKFVPVYVGKASKGVLKRMKEHENGFKGILKSGTKSGATKRSFIVNCHKNGFNVCVYARISQHVSSTLLKAISIDISAEPTKHINLNSLEEDIFFAALRSEGLDNKLLLNGRNPTEKNIKAVFNQLM